MAMMNMTTTIEHDHHAINNGKTKKKNRNQPKTYQYTVIGNGGYCGGGISMYSRDIDINSIVHVCVCMCE